LTTATSLSGTVSACNTMFCEAPTYPQCVSLDTLGFERLLRFQFCFAESLNLDYNDNLFNLQYA